MALSKDLHFAIFCFYLIFIAFSSGIDLPDDVKDKKSAVHEVCAKKLDISDDLVTNYDGTEKNPDMMCYMKCIYDESPYHMEDSDGAINYDTIIENVHPIYKAMFVAAKNECDIDKIKNCEDAYNLSMCLKEQDSDLFLQWLKFVK